MKNEKLKMKSLGLRCFATPFFEIVAEGDPIMCSTLNSKHSTLND